MFSGLYLYGKMATQDVLLRILDLSIITGANSFRKGVAIRFQNFLGLYLIHFSSKRLLAIEAPIRY